MLGRKLASVAAAREFYPSSPSASSRDGGSVHSDELTPNGFATNHAGGILGGISSGQEISVNVAFKPTSSIPQERNSIDKNGQPVMMQTTGRHDPCVGIRAVPVGIAMTNFVLADLILINKSKLF